MGVQEWETCFDGMFIKRPLKNDPEKEKNYYPFDFSKVSICDFYGL